MNRPRTSDELMRMPDDQIEKLIPREWRPMFPGKEIASLGNWIFYLQDGESWDIRKREIVKG
jgi:hypothetical protein